MIIILLSSKQAGMFYKSYKYKTMGAGDVFLRVHNLFFNNLVEYSFKNVKSTEM